MTTNDAPPTATVKRTGRFTYMVSITHGMFTYGPDGYGWIVLGRKRAERKAQRELARYIHLEGYKGDITQIETRKSD